MDYFNFSLGYLAGGITMYYSRDILFSLAKTYLLTKDYLNNLTKNTATKHVGSDKIILNDTLVKSLTELKNKFEHIPEDLCQSEITVSKCLKNGDNIVFFSGSNLIADAPESLLVTCILKTNDDVIDVTGIVNNILMHDSCLVFSDELYNWINRYFNRKHADSDQVTLEYMTNDYNMDVLTKGEILYLNRSDGTVTKIKLI